MLLIIKFVNYTVRTAYSLEGNNRNCTRWTHTFCLKWKDDEDEWLRCFVKRTITVYADELILGNSPWWLWGWLPTKRDQFRLPVSSSDASKPLSCCNVIFHCEISFVNTHNRAPIPLKLKGSAFPTILFRNCTHHSLISNFQFHPWWLELTFRTHGAQRMHTKDACN